ncbi:hypothetical protein [Bacillus paralicheniformis]|uniref:hypothetical protein n=2 Tax=Bacillus paralicheniformis TaxID=1648923 RepID=UPI000D028159|nr:hypothetical protein [Bacillus paralicheniformis]
MMFAPDAILRTWRRFDAFPMETLTKVWFYHQGGDQKQRNVSMMKEHHQEYGIAGNCFDLSIWLLDEFTKDGVEAFPIGRSFKTERAHAAVIALDERGRRFLCDLGDQWLQPILIDCECEDYTSEKLDGFFPAAQIQVKPTTGGVKVLYHRPNGKVSTQVYSTEPVDMSVFWEAAECSQAALKPAPLLECRIPFQHEIAHWEFSGWDIYLSTSKGLYREAKPDTIEGWTEKIHDVTGYDKNVIKKALEIYQTRA